MMMVRIRNVQWVGALLALWLVLANGQVTYAQRASAPASPVLTQSSSHRAGVDIVEVNEEETIALTAAADGTCRLWDVASGRMLTIFYTVEGGVLAAHFIPGLPAVAVLDATFHVRVFDTKTFSLVTELGGGSEDVATGGSLAPDGTVAVRCVSATTTSHQALIYDLRRLVVLDHWLLPDHGSQVGIDPKTHTVRVSVYSAATERTQVLRYSYVLHRPVDAGAQMLEKPSTLLPTRFSPDEQLRAVQLADATLELRPTTGSGRPKQLRQPGRKVLNFQFSPRGTYLLVGYNNATAGLWRTATGTLAATLQGTMVPLTGLVHLRKSNELLVSAGNELQLLDLTTGKPRSLLSLGGDSSILDFKVNAPQEVVAVRICNRIGTTSSRPTAAQPLISGLVVLHLRTGQRAGRCANRVVVLDSVGTRAYGDYDFAPDGQWLYSVSELTRLTVWAVQTRSGQLLAQAAPPTRGAATPIVQMAVFDPSGRFLLVSYAGLTNMRVWDVATGHPLTSVGPLEHPTRRLISYAGGRRAAALLTNELWVYYDAETQRLRDLPEQLAYCLPLPAAATGIDSLALLISPKRDALVLSNEHQRRNTRLFSQKGHTYVNGFYTPDGQYAVGITDRHVLDVWRTADGKAQASIQGPASDVEVLTYLPATQQLVTLSADYCLRFYDLPSSRELLEYRFLTDHVWAVLSPSGRFDAPPVAQAKLYWNIGPQLITLEEVKERAWEVGLWQRVMSGAAQPTSGSTADVNLSQLPEINIGYATPEGAAHPDSSTVLVGIVKHGKVLGRVALFINDKEVVNDLLSEPSPGRPVPDPAATSLQMTYRFAGSRQLIPGGSNSLRAVVHTTEGEKRTSKDIVFRDNRKKENTRFFALVVGTARYASPAISLSFPAKDARSIGQVIRQGAARLYGAAQTHVRVLTAPADLPADLASRANILAELHELEKQMTSSDVLLLYFSGHGLAWGPERTFCLVTTEADNIDPEKFNRSAQRDRAAITIDQLRASLNGIAAPNQVVILDACMAGNAIDPLVSSRGASVSAEKAIDQLRERTGIYILSGSARDEQSFESRDVEQGLLTYALLRAFSGQTLRLDVNGNRMVEIEPLFTFAQREVPLLARAARVKQEPYKWIPPRGGGDIAIGLLSSAECQAITLTGHKPLVTSAHLAEESLIDPLGLQASLNGRLREVAQEPVGAPFRFEEADAPIDAFRLAGEYRQEGGQTIVIAKVIQGTKMIATKEIRGVPSALPQLLFDFLLKHIQ